MKNPHQQQRKPTDHNGLVGRRMWCASRREWVRVLEPTSEPCDFWVLAKTGSKYITSSLRFACVLVLLCACTALSQAPLPPRVVMTIRVVEINGKLYTNVISGDRVPAAPKKAHTGLRIQWDYDPALLQFVSFRAYGLTNVGKTNSEALWGTTTNTYFDYITSAERPVMFQPRIEAVDVALPKTSGGRDK
jgi:hypothetical protein